MEAKFRIIFISVSPILHDESEFELNGTVTYEWSTFSMLG